MNTKHLKEKLLIAVIAILVDAALTLSGQTDWSNVEEASAIPRMFLERGPAAFMVYIAAYIYLVVILLYIIGKYYSVTIDFAVIYLVVTHMIGAASWFGIFLPGGVEMVPVYTFTPALVWVVIWFAWDTDAVISADTLNGAEERIMKMVEERRKQADQDVIVKCGHCGQWAAIKAPCYKCGAPVG